MEVNTNRQVIMRAGLRRWVIKLYFLLEVIILVFPFVFVVFAPTDQDWALVATGTLQRLCPEAK